MEPSSFERAIKQGVGRHKTRWFSGQAGSFVIALVLVLRSGQQGTFETIPVIINTKLTFGAIPHIESDEHEPVSLVAIVEGATPGF